MAFIQLADLIINTECVATVKLNTYNAPTRKEAIPTVIVCLMLPEGSIDGETRTHDDKHKGVERLEFEGELALAVWNYFAQLHTVEILFD